MLSQPAWRRTAPDSSPSHPAGTRPREETPRPRPPCPVNTVCFLLSLSWTFCAPAPRAATSAVLGATESSLPGATPGLAPWLSLASHRALAAPLAASLSLSLLSGRLEVPWGHFAPGSCPRSCSVPAAPLAVRAGLGQQLQPRWTAGHTEGVSPGTGRDRGVAAPQLLPWCGAVPSGGPRAAPQLPGPAGLGLHPSPLTPRPRGGFRKLLLPLAPGTPSLHPLCCRTDCAASPAGSVTLWGG